MCVCVCIYIYMKELKVLILWVPHWPIAFASTKGKWKMRNLQLLISSIDTLSNHQLSKCINGGIFAMPIYYLQAVLLKNCCIITLDLIIRYIIILLMLLFLQALVTFYLNFIHMGIHNPVARLT